MTRELDTGTTDLLAHIDGHVGVITFNRPERRNALSDAMYEGFSRVLPTLAEDGTLNVSTLSPLMTAVSVRICSPASSQSPS